MLYCHPLCNLCAGGDGKARGRWSAHTNLKKKKKNTFLCGEAESLALSISGTVSGRLSLSTALCAEAYWEDMDDDDDDEESVGEEHEESVVFIT